VHPAGRAGAGASAIGPSIRARIIECYATQVVPTMPSTTFLFDTFILSTIVISASGATVCGFVDLDNESLFDAEYDDFDYSYSLQSPGYNVIYCADGPCPYSSSDNYVSISFDGDRDDCREYFSDDGKNDDKNACRETFEEEIVPALEDLIGVAKDEAEDKLSDLLAKACTKYVTKYLSKLKKLKKFPYLRTLAKKVAPYICDKISEVAVMFISDELDKAAGDTVTDSIEDTFEAIEKIVCSVYRQASNAISGSVHVRPGLVGAATVGGVFVSHMRF